jgi:plasmid stabilization system protein ParE
LAFDVRIADAAIRDAEEYYAYIREHSHDGLAAQNWWDGLLDAIATLERYPARCTFVAERVAVGLQIRQLLYASHRILFDIAHETVRIHRIYPAAGRPLRTLQQRALHSKDS